MVGAGTYWVLLEAAYRFLADSYVPVPQWWSSHLHTQFMATASWFVLLNATGAFLAGIPVAFGVLCLEKAHRQTLALLVGILPSLWIMGSGLVTYGLPTYVAAWMVDSSQFLSIGLAVSVAVALFSRLPLTFVRADAP
jgi:hypothetical protein